MAKEKNKKKQSKFSELSRLPRTVVTFVKEAREELKKVSWPDRQTTIRYTVIVIVASLFVGVIIGGIDYMFTLALEQII